MGQPAVSISIIVHLDGPVPVAAKQMISGQWLVVIGGGLGSRVEIICDSVEELAQCIKAAKEAAEQ